MSKLPALIKDFESPFGLRKLRAYLRNDAVAYTAVLEEELAFVKAQNAAQRAFVADLLQQVGDIEAMRKTARAEVEMAIKGVEQLIKEVTASYTTITQMETRGE